MVKVLLFIALFFTIVWSEDTFERRCEACHKVLPTSLQMMLKHYLLVYGGEKNVKAGLKHYLKHPSKEISVMSDLFIDNYGIKQRTTLNDRELEEALDIYWEKFKVIGRLE